MAEADRVTDFWDAIKAGDQPRVEELAGHDPTLLTQHTAEGLAPAMLAVYHGMPNLAEWLADRGDELTIFEAAALGRAERVSACLAMDAGQLAAVAPDGFSALGLAAYFGRLPVVDLLLRAQADPNIPSHNPLHATPLQSAVSAGHFEVAQRLLQAGADPDAHEAGGFTPLHAAAQNGDASMVELLLRSGARQMRAEDGRTPLDLAQADAHTAVIQILSEAA